jgi:hypothetical protein
MFVSLLATALTIAAPLTKDPDRDWLADLVDQPAEKLPWMALGLRVREMPKEEWMEIGQRLNRLLAERAKKQGWEPPDNEFSLVEKGKMKAESVPPAAPASTLLHWKWFELHKGKPPTFNATKDFWDTGGKK